MISMNTCSLVNTKVICECKILAIKKYHKTFQNSFSFRIFIRYRNIDQSKQ